MKRIATIVLMGAVVFASCSKKAHSSKSTTATTNTVTEETVKTNNNNVDAAAMVAQGKTVYETRCNKCHGLKTVNNYTAQNWDGILKSMAPKAHLNQAETDQVTAYVKANAKQ